MTQPCTRRSLAGEVIGTPCPDCGHINLVHPNYGNRALEACVLCELVQLRDQLAGTTRQETHP